MPSVRPPDSGSEPSPDRGDDAFRGSARVRAADRAATIVITAGGLGVIAAVLGICLYLAYVTLPLLAPGDTELVAEHPVQDNAVPAGVLLDEYLQTAAWIGADGRVEHRLAETGQLIAEAGASREPARVAVGVDAIAGIVTLATDDGLDWERVGFGYRLLDDGTSSPHAEQLLDGRWRVASVSVEPMGSVTGFSGVVAADVLEERRRTLVAAIDSEGGLALWSVRRSRSLVGGGGAAEPVRLETPSELFEDAHGVHLLAGGHCVVIRRDGGYDRLAVGRTAAELVERGSLWQRDAAVTAATPLIGRKSLIVGTETGELGTWWVGIDPLDPDDAGRLIAGPALPRVVGAVTAIESSHRDRSILVGDDSGGLSLLHASSGKTIASIRAGGAIGRIAVGPKLNGFLAEAGGSQIVGSLDVGHPDITLRSLFGAMLYEGQLEPMYVYQASGATDAAEPKLSLVPLIFGTLKATVVAMLFAGPIAILAAIYTSEFLSPRLRRFFKPLIETMASLPSVVLGFVAAMVIAPFVADHLAVVLALFVITPCVVLLVASIAGVRAHSESEATGSVWLPMYVVAASVMAVIVSVVIAGPLERSLFGPDRSDVLTMAGSVAAAPASGEVVPVEPVDESAVERVAQIQTELARPSVSTKTWLSGVYGQAGAGWLVLIAPTTSALVAIFGWPAVTRISPAIGNSKWGPMARVMSSVVVGLAAGVLLAAVLERSGVDPRDSVLGVFTQRNTFVIGIVMGFAIIPIIFTISDDALQSVPSSLRAASLGAGATRWQTAVRVVMPVAASGIFSATMIGLGRAVGETMIVLMATGNTPIMDWNIFEGLRTLSANIAVELPEAERGGTHYRLLFLCGVVLFVMTFVVNTTAEIVRQRFRKRNALL